MVEQRKGRRLCIDFGKKKLGIAISDPTGTIAQPLSVIERKNDDLDIEKIRQIIDMYDVKKIVVGLPLTLSGQVGQSALEVHRFSEKLGTALTEVDIDTWDERLSTVFAEREMIRDNVRRKRRKEVIDQLAATIILQSYLDAESRDS
jgi:putative Holliday junction resolvase